MRWPLINKGFRYSIFNGHLYNLRQHKTYQSKRGSFDKTRPTKVNIGERRKPAPDGCPGYLRVDSVHQGYIIPNIWAADYIYGIEPRPELGLAAKVNMILHGDGNMNIFIEDGLQPFSFNGYSRRWKDKNEGILAVENKSGIYEDNYENEQFDVVITNPPFSVQTDGLDSYATHQNSFLYHDYANSENLFLERHYQLLREGGKLAAVLPESVFDTSENKYIRNFLYRYFMIDAVVSLTQEAFTPFTSTKTSLLFATKRTKSEVSAYDDAWRKATNAYGKLRKTQVIQAIIENDKVMNGKGGLIKLASDLEIEFLPEKNRMRTTLPLCILRFV